MSRSILKSQSRYLAVPATAATRMSPWEAVRRLAHLPDLVFLDSALPRQGAVSRIAASPHEVIEGGTTADWAQLRQAIQTRAGTPGFAAGYVEYDGHFRFGIYPRLLTYLHDEQHWLDAGDLGELMRDPAATRDAPIDFRPELTAPEYDAMVRRAQDYIAAGDIYQVNLAHRFTARWTGALGDALAFYGRLRECSPAPYATLLCTPRRVVASSSPELFLKMDGREIITRPIKGTRSRAPGDPAADTAAARELGASAKERAELIMITDLERNDLGQVCDYGTVHVRELLKLERFAQVHHMVSTVAGRLREDVDHIDALRACFPGGSITGAPKKRAREIIAELEPASHGGHYSRGLYTGAIGYFGFDGCSAFNIAIRTAILGRDGRAHFHAGAGIVADSDPRREWEETLWKAAGILRAGGLRIAA
jgi:anthranilate/para-aminobenzoate synthase component I